MTMSYSVCPFACGRVIDHPDAPMVSVEASGDFETTIQAYVAARLRAQSALIEAALRDHLYVDHGRTYDARDAQVALAEHEWTPTSAKTEADLAAGFRDGST